MKVYEHSGQIINVNFILRGIMLRILFKDVCHLQEWQLSYFPMELSLLIEFLKEKHCVLHNFHTL